MPWTYSEEYYREYTRTTWNESAEAYVSLLRNLAPFRSDLIDALSPRTGDHVLDMGTGPGEPAMAIAERVGESGRVLGVDLSENMISIAHRVALARGFKNVEFRVMDCGHLELPDQSFDAVVSSFGFQIFTNPERGAAEAHRVLKPGGRIAVSVWSTGEKVPALDAIIGPMLEHAEPDENGYIPTPYETGGPGEMVTFLEEAGFVGASESRVQHALRFTDAEDYLNAFLKATPIGHSLREESPEVQTEVLEKTRANLKRWQTPTGLEIPGEVVIVHAHR